MSYQKTDYQNQEFISRLLNCSHSLGAGGVSIINSADIEIIKSEKRLEQLSDRGFRAIGLWYLT